MKYSRKELDEILNQILTERKNYSIKNGVDPNVIYILKDLYDALRIYKQLPLTTDFCDEYLFGMKIYTGYHYRNLRGNSFILNTEFRETFYDKIKSCKSPEEMRDLFIKYFPCNDKNQILDWLNSDFKYKM